MSIPTDFNITHEINGNRKRNPGQNVSKRKKGVVSPEKDMIIYHILLGGNDPFFAFKESGLG